MKKSLYASTALAVALTSLLLACGGGGGNSGATDGGSGTGGTPTGPNAPAQASRFDVAFDKGSLPSSNTEQANLTVTTLDANGGVVAGAPITVSVDSGIFVAETSPAVSAADGTFKGYIKVGGNRSNRIINVTVTAAGSSIVNPIIVTGSSITINGLPAAIQAGTTVNNVSVKFTDSANNPLSQQSVNLTQALGAGITLSKAFPAMTDADGMITFSLTAAPTAATGTQTLAFDAGSRTPATRLFTVSSSAANSVPVVPNGTVISTTSVLANPTFVTTNFAGDMTNKSTIVAKFLDNTNAGVENLRVRFRITSFDLAGEQLSPNTSAALSREFETFTNASGQATVNYVPGSRSSPTNGVTVEACFRRNDIDPWTNCATPAAQLTVGGQALDIAIFDGNRLESPQAGGQIYEQTLVIQIADAAGNAVTDTDFSASVDITHYGKAAAWGLPYPNDPVPPTIVNTYDANGATFGLSRTNTPAVGASIWCVSEDTNRNGSLDTGEDLNSNLRIDPKKSDVVVSFPKGRKTDANGRGEIKVSYGQNVGGWLSYTVRATANVAGSEGSSSRSFVTGVLQGDVANGSFKTPPYGRGACNQAN